MGRFPGNCKSFGTCIRFAMLEHVQCKAIGYTSGGVYVRCVRHTSESYCRRLRSLLLCLCDVIRALINCLFLVYNVVCLLVLAVGGGGGFLFCFGHGGKKQYSFKPRAKF